MVNDCRYNAEKKFNILLRDRKICLILSIFFIVSAIVIIVLAFRRGEDEAKLVIQLTGLVWSGLAGIPLALWIKTIMTPRFIRVDLDSLESLINKADSPPSDSQIEAIEKKCQSINDVLNKLA